MTKKLPLHLWLTSNPAGSIHVDAADLAATLAVGGGWTTMADGRSALVVLTDSGPVAREISLAVHDQVIAEVMTEIACDYHPGATWFAGEAA